MFLRTKAEHWNPVFLLYGPALLFDGLVTTLTLGFVVPRTHTEISLRIARWRMK
jgi:hypothetical protein